MIILQSYHPTLPKKLCSIRAKNDFCHKIEGANQHAKGEFHPMPPRMWAEDNHTLYSLNKAPHGSLIFLESN